MKKIHLPLLLIILLAKMTYAQSPTAIELSKVKAQSAAIKPSLIILDGKEISSDAFDHIDPANIESISVVKGKDALKLYGNKGKGGVVEIKSTPVIKGSARWREALDPSVTEIWEPRVKKITAGTKAGDAPSDAIVLFDGKDLNNWLAQDGSPAKWEVKDGAFTVVKGTGVMKTKQTFGDIQLHIEWRSPTEIVGEGQGRGNSGIFLQERYELQVLDSYESQTYSNGQAGAIYKQTMPMANPVRQPGEWQVYDVVYTAPVFSESGRVITPAYITALLNGVIVQNHTEIKGPTEYKGLPVYATHGKGSLVLQDHGNPVSFRNIWVREL
jgi:hypothetical protein